jgi:hypothetical protein
MRGPAVSGTPPVSHTGAGWRLTGASSPPVRSPMVASTPLRSTRWRASSGGGDRLGDPRRWVASDDGAWQRLTGGVPIDSDHSLARRGTRKHHGALAKLLRRSKMMWRSPECMAACATQRRPWRMLVFINSTLVLDSHILITYTSSFIIPGCHPWRWKLKVFNSLSIISCD